MDDSAPGSSPHLASDAADPSSAKMYRRNGRPPSCEPCRKSKLRCDHAAPCGRCIRRRRVDQCFYHPNPLTKVGLTCVTNSVPRDSSFLPYPGCDSEELNALHCPYSWGYVHNQADLGISHIMIQEMAHPSPQPYPHTNMVYLPLMPFRHFIRP